MMKTPLRSQDGEASEEIGLNWRDIISSPPLQVEHLCEMPTYLAASEHVLRPCVAFLHSRESRTCRQADSAGLPLPWFEPAEVAAVFSAPLKGFLYSEDIPAETELPGKGTDWYRAIGMKSTRSRTACTISLCKSALETSSTRGKIQDDFISTGTSDMTCLL